MYSSTLSLTLGLDEVGAERDAPAVLPPEKNRYPSYRRVGGPQGRSGRVRKISPPTAFDSPGRPARSESLFRLCYRGHSNLHKPQLRFMLSVQKKKGCSYRKVRIKYY